LDAAVEMARCVGACRPSPSSAPPSTRSP